MAHSVYKICSCRDRVKCRHPWWFSFKRRGIADRIRKSLDVVLEKHIDSKTVAEVEAERLRIGMIDDTLPARTRELLGLPASTKPQLATLTIAQLLKVYEERHVSRSATADRQRYQIGVASRTVLPRPAGGEAPLGDWLVADVTADTLERLREARSVPDVRKRDTKGSNRVGGQVAANRDLRLLRAAFNWALRTGYVERTPFKRGTVSAVTLTKELARSRRLQTGEADRLLAKCGARLRVIVEAALETGCRKGELLNLEWSQVQLEGRPELWLPADKTKTGKARRVPISTRLKAILEMRRDTLRATLELKPDETLGHANIAQTSTYLAASAAGEHEAMRRFEERLGRLTPIDTGGATPPPDQASAASTATSETQQSPTKH